LLGAKKADGRVSTAEKPKNGLLGSFVTSAPSSPFESAIDSRVTEKVNADLQKQFNSGLELRKQQLMGRKGGLGFTG